MNKPRNERKATRKQMLFKLSGKFNWEGCSGFQWIARIPEPRNVEYQINYFSHSHKYILYLYRLMDKYGCKHGTDMHIGDYQSLEEAKNRAELREARYEVKKAAMEKRNESMEK